MKPEKVLVQIAIYHHAPQKQKTSRYYNYTHFALGDVKLQNATGISSLVL